MKSCNTVILIVIIANKLAVTHKRSESNAMIITPKFKTKLFIGRDSFVSIFILEIRRIGRHGFKMDSLNSIEYFYVNELN